MKKEVKHINVAVYPNDWSKLKRLSEKEKRSMTKIIAELLEMYVSQQPDVIKNFIYHA